jgi:predicted phosphodiesterase
MRVLIISDVHANYAALEAVLADAATFEFQSQSGFDAVWCLGDLVGYGPDPNECLERMRAFGDEHVSVAGNHDWAVLGRLAVDDFNPEARRAVLWTREQLTAANRIYLEGLSAEPLVRGDFTITHASPRHPVWEYVVSPFIAWENFGYFDTKFCLVGHTHVPMVFLCPQGEQQEGSDLFCRALAPSYTQPVLLSNGHRLIINPGSVGQPRDSDPRAAYALLETDSNVIRYRRIAYPFELTQARMRAAKLPDRLIARLAYGW